MMRLLPLGSIFIALTLPAHTPELVPYQPAAAETVETLVSPADAAGHYRGELELGERTLRYAAQFEPDGSFRRREEIIGADGKLVQRVDSVGRFEVSKDSWRLLLVDQERRRHLFDRLIEAEWRPFDLEGPTRQAFGRLRKIDSAEPVVVEARLRATVERDEAGVAVRDCASGVSYRVEKPGKLDRELPADGLLVAISGEFAGSEGATVMRKAKVLAEQPGNCAATDSAQPLANTYWRLVRVGREDVDVPAGRREPHLRFAVETGRFLGQGLCNRLGGSFDTVGDAIRLRQIDRLPHPCPAGTLGDEEVFDALEAAQRFRIKDGVFELIDARGRVGVRFEEGPAAGR
jgi:heat shock protein HslJ